MAETTTETAPTPTEAAPTSQAAAEPTLLSAEPAVTTTQPSEPAKETPAPKPAEETPAKPEGAPEKYDFKAPEGKEYDAAVLEPFSEAAKAANLTQDAAQKLLDTMAPQLAQRQADQVKAIQDGWRTSTQSDKELAGDAGDKLPANLAISKKALDTFDPIPAGQKTTEFRKLLETTGLGNNPEVIRILYRAGKAISEDSFVQGSTAPRGAGNLAAKLYPNTPQKE